MKRKTKEEYAIEFKENMEKYHPNIEILDEYINSSTKLNCKCKIDGYEWMSSPNNLISKNRKRGCPKCGGNVCKMHTEFLEELKIKQPYLELLNTYINNNTKIKLRCLKCNSEFEILPSKILKNKRHNCCFCNHANKMSKSDYIEKLKCFNENIQLIGEYKNSHTKTTHFCLIHNIEFEISPNHALGGQGCTMCKLMKIGNSKRKYIDEYIGQLSRVTKTIILNGEYISGNNPTPHKCLKCGNEWSPYPLNLLKGYDCPICSSSKGEKQIKMYLEKYKVKNIEQFRFDNCKYKKTLPFDFYLEEYNACIEFQGEQHYRPVCFGGISIEKAIQNFEITKIRDQIKKNYCIKNNINLLEIKYDDFSKIEYIIKNFIERK